jgi:hypothetical protein
MNKKGFHCLFLLVVLIAVSSYAYGQYDSDKGKRWLEFDLSHAQLFFGTLLPYSTQSATVHMQVTSPGPPPSINYTQSGNILWQYNQATVAEIRVKSSGGNNINLFSISIPQKNINLTSGSAYLQLKLDNPYRTIFLSEKNIPILLVGGELSVNNTKPGGTYTGYYNVVFNYY